MTLSMKVEEGARVGLVSV